MRHCDRSPWALHDGPLLDKSRLLDEMRHIRKNAVTHGPFRAYALRPLALEHRMRRGSVGLLGAAVFALGCASSSIKRDEGLVRAIANERSDHRLLPALRSRDLPRVAERDVEDDGALSKWTKQLLGKPLTADSATRIALLQNRELRAALRDIGVTRGEAIQASVPPNPRLHAELFPGDESELELGVEIDLVGSILAPARSRALAPMIEAARFDAASAVLEVGYRARVAFYALSAAEQRVAIARQSHETLLAGLDATRAMRAAGNVPERDLPSAEVAAERAGIEVAQLELEQVSAREELQRILGVDVPDGALPAKAGLDVVPAEPDLAEKSSARALRSSFALRAMQLRLESLERQAGLTRASGWLPDLSVELLARRDEREDDEFQFGAGVSVDVPLFDRNQGAAGSLEAQRDALLERYFGQVVTVRSLTRQAEERVRSAHARARKYQDVIVPAQARLAEQLLLHYNAMQIGIFELLQARREQLAVQLAYVQTLEEYWSSVAALQALLAGHAPSVASMRTRSHGMAGMEAGPKEGGH
jgi:cobalt-zinc-cadmium efflux system outer membrane protein